MKKTYQAPTMEWTSIDTQQLMQASGVYGDGIASDITYGGKDSEGKEPQSKPTSVWDD